MQLLNALFPPYLVSYPVPSLSIDEIRALRQKIYLAVMTTAHSLSAGGDLQKALLACAGIEGTWATGIWPTLKGYFDHVRSVQETLSEAISSRDNIMGSQYSRDSGKQPSTAISGPGGGDQNTSSSSAQYMPVQPILKTSASSMSEQTLSIQGSLHASTHELAVHPLARELSGLGEQAFLELGLALRVDYDRVHSESFNRTRSPTCLNTHPLPSMECSQKSLHGKQTPSPPPLQPRGSIKRDETDDVFFISRTPRKESILKATAKITRHLDDARTAFPLLEPNGVKPATNPSDPTSNSQVLTTSEHTLKLLKSSWKSTERLIAKFRSQERRLRDGSVIPDLPFNIIGDARQQREDFPQPPDHWQCARAYLLEKIKAEKEGRQCALTSPPPEWFTDLDDTMIRQPLFTPKLGLDTTTKIVASVPAGSNGHSSFDMRTASSESSAPSLEALSRISATFQERPQDPIPQCFTAREEATVGA